MRFFDTNILVYTQSDQDPLKRKVACDLIAEALETAGAGCISTQVIQEFCNAMRRKTQRTTSEINALLDYFLDLWRCDISPELAREALAVQDEYGIQAHSIVNINDIIAFLESEENRKAINAPEGILDKVYAYREKWGAN